MDNREASDDRSPYANAVPDLARATLWPSVVAAVLGGVALLIWGITWITLDRPLGWVLVLLGVGALAALGRIVLRAARTRRARRR